LTIRYAHILYDEYDITKQILLKEISGQEILNAKAGTPKAVTALA
jgi:hypothetical protein